jgi:hypothetical protein
MSTTDPTFYRTPREAIAAPPEQLAYAALMTRPDEQFFPHGDEFRGLRVHQTRLQGGDASSDSYCHTG